MKESEVLSCQIQEWYPRFRRVSLKTAIHVLPEAFVSFLLEDGVFLSSSSEAMPARTVVTCPQLQSEGYESWDEEDEDEEDEEDENGEVVERGMPEFPELEKAVKESIEKLGGAVFPKLNWSAPKDTAWISTSGSLKCRNFGEIALLLKASDNAAHDLCHAFDSCGDKTKKKKDDDDDDEDDDNDAQQREERRPEVMVLALRKWYDLRPELEFRAFVCRGLLVGICQREVTGFYPFLVGKEHEFEFAISNFFQENIRRQFELENYSFDCYVTTKNWKVTLLDFNPWRGPTLPLLFSWEELEANHARVSSEIARVSARINAATAVEVDDGAGGVAGIQEGLESVTITPSSGDEVPGATCSNRTVEYKGEEKSGSEHQGEYRVELRIVVSEGLVQPGMKIGTGVPIDFAHRGNWEEFIRDELAKEAQVAEGS